MLESLLAELSWARAAPEKAVMRATARQPVRVQNLIAD